LTQGCQKIYKKIISQSKERILYIKGTIWRSGWIPARNLRLPLNGISHKYPGYSPEKTFTDYEARNYVERFFPNALEHDVQNSNQPQKPINRPQYPSYRPPYNQGYVSGI